MFRLSKLHVLLHLKSGQTIHFRARKVTVNVNNENVTTYQFDGMAGRQWAVPIHQIAGVEIYDPLYLRILKWIFSK